jgi:SAM-dependent methyltransferase
VPPRLATTARSLVLALFAAGCVVWTSGEVPFVPTPPEVIDRMLELARVTERDLVYDVGSGEGDIVIRAAKRFGARAVGIEIDPERVRRSRARAEREGVGHLVEFRHQDGLEADLSEATVVTLYMLPEFNAKLRPRLERELRSGARVVSHDFPIDGWEPSRIERMPGGWLHAHTIYLFEIR